MPTVVGILTFMSWKIAFSAYLSLKTAEFFLYFYTYDHLKFYAQLIWAWKKFYNLGPWSGPVLFAYVYISVQLIKISYLLWST